MGKLFNLDAPIVQWLGKVGQMMVSTVIWLLCCLPVVTIGAATVALYRIMFNLKEDRSCALKVYFQTFRESFWKATALWLLMLVCCAILLGLYFVMVQVENMILRMVVLAIFCLLFFTVYFYSLYAFPLTAYFENTLAGTIRNAIGMSIGNLRYTIIACAVTLIPLVMAILVPKLFLQMLYLWMILGPGALAYGVCCALSPVFQRYIPGNEEEC